MEGLLNLKYLIVDDMFTMRKLMRRTLDVMGIKNVTDAKDGKVACDLIQLEAAKGAPFQMIISDWNMPEMSGLDLLKYCRAHESFKKVGFILVTAEADPSQAEVAKLAGVDQYVLKPLDDKIFLDILKAVYSKRIENIS